MARAAFTVQTLTRAGAAPTFTAVASVDGYGVPNAAGKTILHFRNTNAAPRVVTVVTQPTVDGAAIAEKTFTVAATTGEIIIGPFDPNVYNSAYDSESLLYNCLYVSFDAIAGLTMAAYLPAAL